MAKDRADEMAKGVDPVVKKNKEKTESLTLGEAADEYIRARTDPKTKKPLKESTVKDIRICMKALADWQTNPAPASYFQSWFMAIWRVMPICFCY